MILQAILIAMLLTQPGAAPGEATETPARAEPAAMTTEQAIAAIDTLMTPWKGKSGERLRGRLGLTENSMIASDGQVSFWMRRSEATACGVSETGVIRCGVSGGSACRLAVAFDKTGKVTGWRATGTGDACEPFLNEIGAPE